MRLRCRLGRHQWGDWKTDVHEVSLVRIINAPPDPSPLIKQMLGYEYVRCIGSTYRTCERCPALERRLS